MTDEITHHPFEPRRQDGAASASEKLCPRCSIIDIDNILSSAQQPETTNGGLGLGTLIPSLGPVRSWSPHSCGLCSVLLSSIPATSRADPPDDYSLRFHYAQDRRLGIYYPLLKALPPSTAILKLDGPNAQAHYVSSPFLALQRKESKNDSARVRVLRADLIDFNVVRDWLGLCRELHTGKCAARAPLSVAALKLIDCKTRYVIKVDPAKPKPYVTLSYVCGTINDPPLAPDCLPTPAPETIEDAIKVTLHLGLRYLWVDRYCIDQQNLDNKLAQIQQMNLIYSNSEVTLIAAAGTDAYYGLPGVSGRARAQHSYSNLGAHQIISTLQPVGPVRGTLGETYWSSRAWCYQEALLSKRRLIFTSEQVSYECAGMSACEVLDLPYREMHNETGQSFRDEYLYFSTREIGKFTGGVGKKPYHLFQRIEEYTKKNLSFQSDRLNAFLGILNRFERELYSARHLWGQPMIPEMDLNHLTTDRERESAGNWYGVGSFVDGLAWGLRGSKGRERDRPSWSWTGWSSSVRYKYIYSTMHIPADFPLPIFEFETDNGQLLSWERFQAEYSAAKNSSQSCRTLGITAMTMPIRLVANEPDGEERCFELDMRDSCYLTWPATTTISPNDTDAADTVWLLHPNLPAETHFHALMMSLSTMDDSPNYLFLMIIAEVEGRMERVGGGWLGPETKLCDEDGDVLEVEEDGKGVNVVEVKYGRDWWKFLVRKRGVFRLG